MKIRFDKLFDVVIHHGFYTSNVSEDFLVRPTRGCAAQLRRYGLLFRTTPEGFVVLYEAVADTNGLSHPLRPIDDSVTFSFLLQPRNPWVVTYSDLPFVNPARQLYRLTNWNDNPQDGLLLLSARRDGKFLSGKDVVEKKPLVFAGPFPSDKSTVQIEIHNDASLAGSGGPLLAKTIQASGGSAEQRVDLRSHGPGRYALFVDGVLALDCYASDEILHDNVFGVIDICRHDKVPSAYQFTDPTHGHDVRARTYTLEVNNRRTFWRYYMVLKYRLDIQPEQLSIARANNGMEFQREPTQQRADGTKVVPFTSEEELPLGQKQLTGLQLRRTEGNGQPTIEIQNLPNPSARALNTRDDQHYSEVFVYL